MNIAGIITEYNPFHNGHLYHIKKTREITKCDGIICIMSGNFVQRGTPAILDKWSRANIALCSGVDLVIELPLIYSISSAEFFAYGAISLLNSLGNINSIVFGSESGDINNLWEIAKILYKEPEKYKSQLKKYLDKGFSFPVCRAKSLNDFFIDSMDSTNLKLKTEDILKLSNNILGIEYCKSLLKLESSIKPYTFERIGSLYKEDKLNGAFSSATSIRNILKNNCPIELLKGVMPEETIQVIESKLSENCLVFEDSIFKYIRYKALTIENTLGNLPDASEGLNNKIYDSLYKSNSYEELIDNAKSKRYSHTRISRILCQYFIGLDSLDKAEHLAFRNSPAPYARVIGFNNKGREILKKINKTSTIPVYTKLPKSFPKALNLDLLATKAYSLLNSSVSPGGDFTISPIHLL